MYQKAPAYARAACPAIDAAEKAVDKAVRDVLAAGQHVVVVRERDVVPALASRGYRSMAELQASGVVLTDYRDAQIAESTARTAMERAQDRSMIAQADPANIAMAQAANAKERTDAHAAVLKAAADFRAAVERREVAGADVPEGAQRHAAHWSRHLTGGLNGATRVMEGMDILASRFPADESPEAKASRAANGKARRLTDSELLAASIDSESDTVAAPAKPKPRTYSSLRIVDISEQAS